MLTKTLVNPGRVTPPGWSKTCTLCGFQRLTLVSAFGPDEWRHEPRAIDRTTGFGRHLVTQRPGSSAFARPTFTKGDWQVTRAIFVRNYSNKRLRTWTKSFKRPLRVKEHLLAHKAWRIGQFQRKSEVWKALSGVRLSEHTAQDAVPDYALKKRCFRAGLVKLSRKTAQNIRNIILHGAVSIIQAEYLHSNRLHR